MSHQPPKPEAPNMTRRKTVWILALMVVATCMVAYACSFVGHVRLDDGGLVSPWPWTLWSNPIWKTRVFRLAAAASVGAGLSTAGIALQALLRNPLAEPYVLGISSGAGVGVLLGSSLAGVLALPDWATTPALAAIGAGSTTLLVYVIAVRRGRLDPYVLLLSGVIVNVFNGALILVILQFVKQTDMIAFIGWGIGQIPEWLWFKPGLLIACLSLILVGWVLVVFRGTAYNNLALGDDVAFSTGVSVLRLRTETFLVASVLTSATVALAGPVGFVGLIIPHFCRLLFGPDHRLLAVICGFAGAMFLMLADTACRFLGASLGVGELPVGVATAVIGGPLFIIVLRSRFFEVAPS